MLKFIKFFQGYLYVVIRGYSPERFLNLCSRNNIVLWNLLPTDDGYLFCISLKAFRKLKPLLRKTGTRIRIQKRCGLPFLLFRYRKHRFFWLGIGSAAIVLFVLSQFIWKVEITGNSYYSSQVLTEYLEDSGFGYGVAKRRTDCGRIETMLRKKFPDITWVSARISGTRLYLIVQERMEGAVDTDADDAPADLVSDCAGTVVSITTRRGTPLVEKGDKIKKGDVLVSGRVDIQNDAGEVVSGNFSRADADVEIRTTIPYQDTFSAVRETMVPTGKKKIQCRLIFGDYDVSFGQKTPRGEDWDCTSRLFPVRVGEDFYLPVQAAVTRYEQFEIRRQPCTDEEIRAKCGEDLQQYYEKLRENGIQILENNVMIDKNDNRVTAKGKLVIVKRADTFREIDPADTQEDETSDGIDTADHGHSQ